MSVASDHEAKGIYSVKREKFYDAPAARKRAVSRLCGEPTPDGKDYFLCSLRCGKELGIVW